MRKRLKQISAIGKLCFIPNKLLELLSITIMHPDMISICEENLPEKNVATVNVLEVVKNLIFIFFNFFFFFVFIRMHRKRILLGLFRELI